MAAAAAIEGRFVDIRTWSDGRMPSTTSDPRVRTTRGGN
jgi:hypothetical protein